MEKNRWISKEKKYLKSKQSEEKDRKKQKDVKLKLERNGIEGAEDIQGLHTSGQLYESLK